MEINTQAAIDFVIALIQLVLGLILGVAAIYLGIRFVDKMTTDLEELAEIKKGNISVGIFIFAVIITFATVLQGGIQGMNKSIGESETVQQSLWALGAGVIQVLFSLIIAVLALYIALWIIQKMAEQINKIKVKGMPKMKFNWEKELEKDNKAFAIFIAGILIGLSFVIQAGVGSIASSLSRIITF